MSFLVDGQPMTLRGTVTLVSADNLASQAIGGYKALHSAFRKCRYCMAVDEDLQSKVLKKVNCISCIIAILSHTLSF